MEAFDHFGNVVCGDLLGHHELLLGATAGHPRRLRLSCSVQLAFQRGNLAVQNPRCRLEVTLAFGLFFPGPQLIKLRPQVAGAV
ncbi:hypothetical protein D9M71_825730 [compost metagenome]